MSEGNAVISGVYGGGYGAGEGADVSGESGMGTGVEYDASSYRRSFPELALCPVELRPVW